MESYFEVTGWWHPRQEDTGGLARRTADFLGRLAELDDLFARWERDGMRHRSIVPLAVTMPPDLTELRDWIEENPQFQPRDGRKALSGHAIHAATNRADRPFSSFWMRSARDVGTGLVGGKAALVVLAPQGNPLALRHLARPILLALATAWETAWAGVSTAAYFGEQMPPPAGTRWPRYEAGWMIYLDPTEARRIADFDGVMAERLRDGVLLTATDGAFDRLRPDHRAAARRMERVLAPLNASDPPPAPGLS